MCNEGCDPTEGERKRNGLFTRRSFLVATAASSTSFAWANTLGGSADGEGDKPIIERICSPAWGAKPPTGNFIEHEVVRLTVHHSARALRRNRYAPARLRDHQAYHQSLGWPDIAYHMLIDRRGNIYQGRPSGARGDTATSYDPSGHYLIMCEGNFSEQPIGKPQVDALVNVLAWASVRFDVKPRKIKGHRDLAATACPGTDLYRLIDNGTIEHRVRRSLDAGGVERVSLCGRAARKRVAAIERGDA